MVLITGATGLVGSHAALFLIEKGNSVRATYRNPDSIQKTKNLFKVYDKLNLFADIDWVQADINDIPQLEQAFTGITEVWHCAAVISFNRRDEDLMRKVNIEGTANMVNLSLAFGVSKFCFVSSVAALGDPKQPSEIIDEETEWNPEKHHSDYAISKYGAEMEVWRAQQEGLKTIIVNPGVVLGPGFWNQGSGEIFSAIEDDLPFYTKGSTGFVAVTDLVEVMYRLMKSEISGERYSVIAENIRYDELAFTIADALNTKRPTIYAKPWMTEISWIMDWILSGITGKKRKIYRETARNLHSNDRYSNKKIIADTGFTFTKISEYVKDVVALETIK